MPIRSRLMFLTSPLVRSLLTLDTANQLQLGRYETASRPAELVGAFIEQPVYEREPGEGPAGGPEGGPAGGPKGGPKGGPRPRALASDVGPPTVQDLRQERVSLPYELQLFVRTAYTYGELVDPGLLAAYALDKRLPPGLVEQLYATVRDLPGPKPGRSSFEDLAPDERAPVVEQVRTLLGPDQPPQAPVSWQPTCSDDEGDGLDALIELAFGGSLALQESRDLTQPEAWPEIFEGAWLEVLALEPWQIDTFPAAPNVTGRSTTIAELVDLPPPFDEPVRLSVSQLEHHATGSTDVDDRSLIYSLAAPNDALTDDAGIVLQSQLGWPTLGPIEHWTGLVLKNLTYRSASYASLTQLVCDRWCHLIERAIA